LHLGSPLFIVSSSLPQGLLLTRFGGFFLGAPSMATTLKVQVLPRAGHSERSEPQLREGDRVWEGSGERQPWVRTRDCAAGLSCGAQPPLFKTASRASSYWYLSVVGRVARRHHRHLRGCSAVPPRCPRALRASKELMAKRDSMAGSSFDGQSRGR